MTNDQRFKEKMRRFEEMIHWRKAVYMACSDELLEARTRDLRSRHAAQMRVRRMIEATTPGRAKKLPRTLRRRIEDHLPAGETKP